LLTLQSQQEQVKEIQIRIPALSETLAGVSVVEEECEAANVEENDYTIFTYQDLAFELELVVQNIAKKIAFIDNQVRGSSIVIAIADTIFQDRIAEQYEPHTCSARAVRGHIPVLQSGRVKYPESCRNDCSLGESWCRIFRRGYELSL